MRNEASKLKLPAFDRRYSKSFAKSPIADSDTERISLYKKSLNLRRILIADEESTQHSQTNLPSIAHFSQNKDETLYEELKVESVRSRVYPKRSFINKKADQKL